MFLDDTFMFSNGFVRSVVMRLERGVTDLAAHHAFVIANSNNTNATSVYELALPGDPVLDFFEMTEEEVLDLEEARLEAEILGQVFVEPVEHSTMVVLEVQFASQGLAAGNVEQKMLTLLNENGGWASGVVWVNTLCFEGTLGLCYSQRK